MCLRNARRLLNFLPSKVELLNFVFILCVIAKRVSPNYIKVAKNKLIQSTVSVKVRLKFRVNFEARISKLSIANTSIYHFYYNLTK